MCFSVTASFATGIALSAVGASTLSKVNKKSEIFLAMIPLLFGVQQIIEGFVWLSLLRNSTLLNQISTCGYTLFSHVLWPIFVPFAITLVETDPFRKKILHALQIIGITVGGYLLYAAIKDPIVSSILNHSIMYENIFLYKFLITGFYVTVVCGSFFVSSEKLLNAFGGVLLISFFTAYYFYTLTFVSVWCFFAAVLSLIIYLYFKNRKQ